MCTNFKIAKGDLTGSKAVTLDNYKIKDANKIKFTTDDIKKMENLSKIAEDLDKETYEKKYNEQQDKISTVDASTIDKVKNELNGYYFEFYVNVGTKLVKYKLEFDSPNKFTVSNNIGMSNLGTYDVRKSSLILNYQTGKSITIEYGYENGEITLLKANDVFGTLIEYDPLGE